MRFGRAHRAVACAAAVLGVVLAGRAAAGGPQDEARDLFVAASDAMKQGDLRKAEELYAQSFSKYPAPTTAFWQARALVRMGRLVEARERYRAAATWSLDAQASDAFRKSIADATTELAALEKRIPVVVLAIEPGLNPVITIDGRRVTATGRIEVDPGEHVVAATAPEHDAFEQTVQASEGHETVVRIALARRASERVSALPAAPTPPYGGSSQRTLGFVVGGIGGAALVAWGVTGALFLHEKAAARDAGCDLEAHTCPDESGLAAVRTGQTLAIVNTVALFGGVGLAGVGVVLVATAPHGETRRARATLRVMGSGIALDALY